MNSLSKVKFAIVSVFIILISFIYIFTESDMQKRKHSILSQQINNLKNSYAVGTNRFEIIADGVNNTIIHRENILKLLYDAKHSKDEKSLAVLRKKLYNDINPYFTKLKKLGVIITLFSFADNKTFLRMHKPDKFGDDLSKIRHSFVYANKTKQIVRGFEQGKISHAFRNIYPIFYKDEYLGSVDIAFSSEVLQNLMEKLHNTDTHFILNKNLFEVNIWKMDGLSKYTECLEHTNFLYTLSEAHKNTKFTAMEIRLNKLLKNKIYQDIEKSTAFALQDNGQIVAFLPIHNMKNTKTVAYLVSYSESQYLKSILKEHIQINIFSFIILLLLSLVVYGGAKKRTSLKQEIIDKDKAFELIFEKSSDGILIFDQSIISQCNEAILHMFGFDDKKQILNKTASELSPLFQPDGELSKDKTKEVVKIALLNGLNNFEWKFKKSNSEEFWALVTLTIIKLNNRNILHALIKDITKQKEKELELMSQKAELSHRAFHDPLTMLPNRALFSDRLTQTIKSASRNKEAFAILFIDLDKFKPINDHLGHLTGDKVLQEVALRLKSKIRKEDTLARIGGDEFTIIMQKLNSVHDATILAQKIIDIVEQPIVIDTHTLNISASIGISLYPQHSTILEELIEYADVAMYKAKNEGKNHFQIYTPDTII